MSLENNAYALHTAAELSTHTHTHTHTHTYTHTHTHTHTHTETNWSNIVYIFYPHKALFLGPWLKLVLKNPVTSIILII